MADNDDLIARLRSITEDDAYARPWTSGEAIRDAADTIERMKSETGFWRARAEAGDDLTNRLTETQHQHVAEISRLEERCVAYKGQVEAGAAEIERLTRERDYAIKRAQLLAETDFNGVLRAARERATTAERGLAEARTEVERLRELFRADGEQHAQFVKNLTKAHEDRITKYADAFKEMRAEVERLRPIVMFLAQTANYFDGTPDDHIAYVSVGTLRRGRAAIEEEGEKR